MTEVDLQEKINSFLRSALKNIFINDYNEAIRDLKAAEVLDKNNPEIIYNLGIAHCRIGLYKTAIGYFQKILNLPTTFVDIIAVKKIYAYSLIHLEKFKEAEKLLDTILKDSPSDVVALNMKGYSLEKSGFVKEAIEEYKKILSYDNQNFNAYNSMAYLLMNSNGDMNKAMSYAQKALKSNKQNPAYLDTVGCLYMKAGKYDKAEKHLKTALAYAPLSEEIRQHLQKLAHLKQQKKKRKK